MEEKTFALEDSNIFMFGSELEYKVKKAASENENEWKSIGNNPGVLVWRIEKFNVKKWPEDLYGSFYDGDSYIILITKITETGDIIREAHMWVGSETTADESGTAAYKIVELDDYFNRKVTLVWNAQGNESKNLISAFGRLHIMKGGIESGFRKVEKDNIEPRLFEIHNENIIQVQLSAENLTSLDSFVLDTQNVIYLWRGKNATRKENFNGATLVQDLKKNRPKVEYKDINQGEEDEIFWQFLGGRVPIKDTPNPKKGAKRTSANINKKLMLKISDESGKLKMDDVDYTINNLNSQDVFLIHREENIFVWIGKFSSHQEKLKSMVVGRDYVSLNNLGKGVNIFIVNEGFEPFYFQQVFS